MHKYLIQILLPLRDNAGKRQKKALLAAVAQELTDRFGGLTAYTRAPAKGLWKQKNSQVDQDEIVIYEVMADKLHLSWWRRYRPRLESRFKQKEILVRAEKIRTL